MENDKPTPPTARKRWRVRFSLRTLVIVVLAYAGLWALTAICGDGIVPEEHRKHQAIVGGSSYMRLSHRPNIMPLKQALAIKASGGVICYYSETTAIAPFLCRTDFEHGVLLEEGGRAFYVPQSYDATFRSWHIWVFGFSYRLADYMIQRDDTIRKLEF